MRVEAQQPFVPDAPVFSHQHTNGEVFTATSIEAAMGVCTALARLSVQEVGLLFELKAMGEQQLADQLGAPRQKPVIKKMKVQTAQSEPQEIIPTVVERATAVVETEASPKTTELKTVEAKDAVVVELVERSKPVVEVWQPEAAYAVPEVAQTAGPQPSAHQDDLGPSRSGAEARFRPAQVFETSITRRELSFDSEQTFAPASEADVPKPAEKAAERPLKVILTIDRPIWQPANLAPRIEEVLTDEPAAHLLKTDPPAYSYEFERVEPTAAEDKGSDAYSLLEADEVLEMMVALEASAVDGSALIPTETQVEQAAPAFALAESVPEFVDAPPTLVTAELPAPAAQVETAMTELLAVLDKPNDAEPSKVDAILAQIVSFAPESDAALAEAPNTLEEKLTDLFIELFEEAGVASTPELIASFVRLTRIRYLDAVLPVRASALTERHSLSSQIGTREFLQKIQHGLRVATRAVVNFYQIGKSALRLYALPAPVFAEA